MIDVDGHDDDHPDCDQLIEGVNTQDDQSVCQHCGDERADGGANY